MNKHVMVLLGAVLLSGIFSHALGGSFTDGSFMFRRWSADGLAEAQAVVTSRSTAAKILSGEQKFEVASCPEDSLEQYIIVRVRALSNQSVWGDLEYRVGQRDCNTLSIPCPIGKGAGWVYYAVSFRGAGINDPTVYLRWKRVYAK